ncbi:MAG: hypothetical protein M1834_008403 [Cirrosporium novae-zelandiae]|nr:MAG: hypothetical protein M1834_008403 [Cirrosporium novae-zelandiae]
MQLFNVQTVPSNDIPSNHDLSLRVLQNTAGNFQHCNLEDSLFPEQPESYTEKDHAKSATPVLYSSTLDHVSTRREQKLRVRAGLAAGQDPCSTDLLRCKSARYSQYRDKNKKGRSNRRNLGKDGKPIWADHVEAAFQYALRKYPPMGRKKAPMNGKACGRNEIIAYFITVAADKKTDRKQVSSHIQVLWGYFGDLPEWIELVRETTPNSGIRHPAYSKFTNALVQQDAEEYKAVLKAGTPFHQLYRNTWPERNWAHDRLVPLDDYQLSTIDFAMYIVQSLEAYVNEALHLFTAMHNISPEPSISLDHLPRWRESFPDFAQDHKARKMYKAEVILLDVSLNLPTDFFPDGLYLRNTQKIKIHSQNCFEKWVCQTRVYERGKPTQDTLRSEAITRRLVDRGCYEMEIDACFQSEKWGELFIKLISIHQEAIKQGGPFANERAEEDIRELLENMTAYQEIALFNSDINVMDTNDERDHKRICLLWKFRQTRPGEPARTIWRRLEEPPLRLIIDSPHNNTYPDLLQIHPAIDYHLEGIRPPDFGPLTSSTDHDSLFDDPSFFSTYDSSGIMNSSTLINSPTAGILGSPPKLDLESPRALHQHLGNMSSHHHIDETQGQDFHSGHINITLQYQDFSQQQQTRQHSEQLPRHSISTVASVPLTKYEEEDSKIDSRLSISHPEPSFYDPDLTAAPHHHPYLLSAPMPLPNSTSTPTQLPTTTTTADIDTSTSSMTPTMTTSATFPSASTDWDDETFQNLAQWNPESDPFAGLKFETRDLGVGVGVGGQVQIGHDGDDGGWMEEAGVVTTGEGIGMIVADGT